MKPDNALPKAAPHIMPLWDHTRNIGINPWNISKWDKNPVYWHCDKCGMSWEEKPINMHQAKGCYYCSGQRPIPGKTDLATLEPELMKEWDWERNKQIGLNPTELTRVSNKRAWWKCAKGHSWDVQINDRVARPRKCPYCSGRRAITGETDFMTLNPALMSEWDWEKNDALGIKPDKITKNSHTEVYWKCSKGHSWVAIPNKRVALNSGCPICNGGFNTSYPEQYIFWSFKQLYPNTINRYKTTNKVEYDIAIPELKLLIEYNGANWHRGKTARDKMKEDLAISNGYAFIAIIGDESHKGQLSVSNTQIIFNPSSGLDVSLNKIIGMIVTLFGGNANNIDYNLSKSQAMIYSKGVVNYEDSLAAKFPYIAAEWDKAKNNGLSPADVTGFSNRKVWWKCGYGHSWEATIINRTANQSMCPTCQAIYKARNSPLK